MKCVWDMVQLVVISAEGNGNNVKANVQIQEGSGKVHIGGANQIFLFLRGDEGLWFSESDAASCLHFTNNQCVFVSGNQVYFQCQFRSRIV